MMTDFRALCSELLQAMDEISEYEVVDWSWVKSKPLKMADESMREARAALDESNPTVTWIDGPEPEDDIELTDWLRENDDVLCPSAPPAPLEGEVGELVAWLRRTGKLLHPDYSRSQVPYIRAATLLEQLSAAAPASVAVVPSDEERPSDGGYESGTMWTGHANLPAAPQPDWRELCEELVLRWDCDGCDWRPQHQDRWNATVAKARTIIALWERTSAGEMKNKT